MGGNKPTLSFRQQFVFFPLNLKLNGIQTEFSYLMVFNSIFTTDISCLFFVVEMSYHSVQSVKRSRFLNIALIDTFFS
jgi:hypothetical protein